MEEVSERQPWRAFRIAIDFTDAEIEAYQRVAGRAVAHPDPVYVGWGIYGTGMALAFIAGRLAVEAGVAHRGDQALVALGVGIVFLIGLGSPSMWRVSARREAEKNFRERVLSASRDLTVLFASGGVCVRGTGTRQFYAWSSFRDVTTERGLMLCWVPEEIDSAPLLVLPLRLMSAEQQAVIAARCPPLNSGSP